MRKRLDFHKIHGAGNDFIVVNNWDGIYAQWEPQFVKHICKQHLGIGADGFLAIERSELANFRMRFFNSDGYESEMCVNGSRCICYLAHTLDIVKKDFTFEAGDGVHKAQIKSNNQVRIQVLWQRNFDSRTFPVDFLLPDGVYFKKFINTGVPHLVLECRDIENLPIAEIGHALRFHPYYQPEGTNINFVRKSDNKENLRLHVRTFERGVDAETFACGSGATACAISYVPDDLDHDTKVEVITRGGKLFISIIKNFADIYLIGPVRYVFKGIYSVEGIL